MNGEQDTSGEEQTANHSTRGCGGPEESLPTPVALEAQQAAYKSASTGCGAMDVWDSFWAPTSSELNRPSAKNGSRIPAIPWARIARWVCLASIAAVAIAPAAIGIALFLGLGGVNEIERNNGAVRFAFDRPCVEFDVRTDVDRGDRPSPLIDFQFQVLGAGSIEEGCEVIHRWQDLEPVKLSVILFGDALPNDESTRTSTHEGCPIGVFGGDQITCQWTKADRDAEPWSLRGEASTARLEDALAIKIDMEPNDSGFTYDSLLIQDDDVELVRDSQRYSFAFPSMGVVYLPEPLHEVPLDFGTGEPVYTPAEFSQVVSARWSLRPGEKLESVSTPPIDPTTLTWLNRDGSTNIWGSVVDSVGRDRVQAKLFIIAAIAGVYASLLASVAARALGWTYRKLTPEPADG